jgi:glycosyltransferase involved in cell wall biosynthesis
VTIGIPTYNRIETLEQSVGAALAQDVSSLEVVISDNASADGTEEYCRRVAAGDPRVRYVRQPVNMGPAANFRAALAAATGHYFMWLSDDDWIDPDYTRVCIEALRAEPGCAIVAGRAVLHEEDGASRPLPVTNLTGRSPGGRLLRYLAGVRDNSCFYGVMRRSDADAARLVPSIGDDWAFMCAIAYLGRVRTLDTTQVHRRAGGSSANITKLVTRLGLPRRVKYWPHTHVATAVRRQILTNDAVFAPAGRLGRRLLAWIATLVLVTCQEVRWYVLSGLREVLVVVIGRGRFERLKRRVRGVSHPAGPTRA